MIDAKTEVYGIIGHPVSHSLSPTIQNFAFCYHKINAVYLAFDVIDLESAIRGIRGLGIKGVSVTIPHKVSVIPLLDRLDELAERTGAVNTILNKDGLLIGYNTDCLGAILAIKEKADIEGKDYVILGAGGAARAIGFGLKKEGANIIIINRTYEKGEALARALGGRSYPWGRIREISGYGLINATPIGMWPNVEQIPISKEYLRNFKVVMDAVYNPLETRLLREAKRLGLVTIDGLKMLVYQGVAQFKIWTGRDAPKEEMLKVAREILRIKEL